ncbi:MAG: hypothetical protein M1817_003362 [Caeruleum heppii]|nr:MAG: hypothetical protein M1817_003362 [Caeruleum heppii]
MPTSEGTPLLRTVNVAPPRQRYPHSTIRRFCTISLSSTLIAIVVLFIIPSTWHLTSDWDHHRPSHANPPLPYKDWPKGNGLSITELQDILLTTPKENKAREWSAYYTSGPHLAGKNLSQALWTKERWQEFGIDQSTIATYDVYLNYPVGHRLALLERPDRKGKGDSSTKVDWKIKFEARLEEDILEEDRTSGLKDRIPTFHGYSASGNVTAPYVYVNYGTYQDFEDLLAANVSLEGKIALARYGHVFRGLKLKRAQDLGMIGTIIYSDPGDDGGVTEENGLKAYPDGPARQPSSVQRGSVEYLSIAPGDPTTPGYPSKPGVPRESVNGTLPSIPSIPISYVDALPLLKALNSHGPNASSFNKYWRSGGLGYKGVDYNVGPSPGHLAVNLMNEQYYTTTPMWNVIGIINGTISDEVVILGNHRDAWVAGGAGDPNSGSAALNEVVRSFGEALKRGWKPLRTIVFASWDGEEYGLIGSTEWVEEYLPWLSGAAVAYLNVDVGTVGSHFHAAASPLLNKALYDVTAMVPSPNQTVAGQSVRDTWNGRIATMGSGSDFTAFQDFAGIPCVDMGFQPGPDEAIYHYHSNYDSFDWMDNLGDPGWKYHATMAKIWGLLAAHLVEQPVIQLNVTDYATALLGYLQDATSTSFHPQSRYSPTITPLDPPLTFPSLHNSLVHLLRHARKFDARATDLAGRLEESIPWWQWWKRARLFYDVMRTNQRLKMFERRFLYACGLDGRSWFKHTVFAPGLWTGYSGATFPGLVESVQKGDWKNAARWAQIIEKQVSDATRSLGTP